MCCCMYACTRPTYVDEINVGDLLLTVLCTREHEIHTCPRLSERATYSLRQALVQVNLVLITQATLVNLEHAESNAA